MSEPNREELQAVLDRRTSALGAIAAAAKLAAASWSVGLPIVLVYGLVDGGLQIAVARMAREIVGAPVATNALGFQIAMGVSVLLAIYGVLQFLKRQSATRESWWPVLFLAPALMVALALFLAQQQSARQLAPIIAGFPMIAVGLAWASFGGAVAAIGWVRSAEAATRGANVSLAEAGEEMFRRALEVSGPHGARVQAISLGAQAALVPGIFYALQLAFTDMIAVLEPDKPALKRSGQLTWGMRGRLFRLLLVVILILNAAGIALLVVIEGMGEGGVGQAVFEPLMNPAGVSAAGLMAQSMMWALGVWFLTLAMLVLYLERERQVVARRGLNALRKAESASE